VIPPNDLPAMPDRLAVLLRQFDLTRARREDKGFVLPHPGREDAHPSVWCTVTEDRILIRDRTGGPTDAILDAIGWAWRDLYAKDATEKAAFEMFADQLDGGATLGTGASKAVIEHAELRHEVYTRSMLHLSLEAAHVAYLAKRGLDAAEAYRRGYRSLSFSGRVRLTRQLAPEFRGRLELVPGWRRDAKGALDMVRAAGLLVPIRTHDGRVAAFKVRQDHDSPRWLYLAGGKGGVGVNNMPHFPMEFPPACAALAVTEGEVKADKEATVPGALPCVAVPGAGMWRVVVPYLKDLGAGTVVIAFDRSPDPERQRAIQATADEFAECLERRGINVEEYQWDATSA
jgi:hypothetical protein